MRSFFLLAWGGWLLVSLAAQPAQAHALQFFAYAAGGWVYTESLQADGSPVVDGRIEVYDGSGQLLLTGATDQQGLFAFPLAVRPDLALLLSAPMGHKQKFLLPRDKMP